MAATRYIPSVPDCLGASVLRLDATSPSGLSWLDGTHASRSGHAGTLDGAVYVVRVHGVQYRAHAIVWALYHGAAPSGPLLFLDGDMLHCQPGNIRLQDAPRTAKAAAKAQRVSKAKVPSTLAEKCAAHRKANARRKG